MVRSHAAELAALVAEAAAAVGLEAAMDGDATSYSVGETSVVSVSGATAEFRLRPDIASAAARTPEAGLSGCCMGQSSSALL